MSDDLVNCDLCCSDRKQLLLIEDDFPISRCLDCSFIYVSQRPRREANEDVHYFVDVDHIKMHSARYNEVFLKYAEEITKLKPQRGKLLDVGCGFGLFMKQANEQDWEVFGIDVSRNATDYATTTLGLSNVGTCALEHAGYEPSPMSVLRECKAVLKEDGLIVVRVPNIAFVSKVWHLRHVLEGRKSVTGANLRGEKMGFLVV